MTTKIRRATLEDAAVLTQIKLSSADKTAHHFVDDVAAWKKRQTIEKMEKSLSAPAMRFWIAYMNELPVGYISRRGSIIGEVFVDVEHFGKRVGSALMTTLEKDAKKHKVAWLFLDASPNAEKFYIKLGFKKISELVFYHKEGCEGRFFKMDKCLLS